MLGGAFLCYEGAEKVFEALLPHAAHEHEAAVGRRGRRRRCSRTSKVAGAIKTDFILSAEIMAITLATIPAGSLWMQAVVLAVVGIGITVAVYGVVALIVKADDVGVAAGGGAGSRARFARFGRGLVARHAASSSRSSRSSAPRR